MVFTHERSFEICICSWQNLIILRWPCAVNRKLKSNYYFLRKSLLIYELDHLCQNFLQRCLWNVSNTHLFGDDPVSSFQRRLSSTSSFHASLLVVDHFHTALFSALEPTHCALVKCDSEWVTVAFYCSFLTISTAVIHWQRYLVVTLLVPRETAAVSASSVYTIQACIMSRHSMQSHTRSSSSNRLFTYRSSQIIWFSVFRFCTGSQNTTAISSSIRITAAVSPTQAGCVLRALSFPEPPAHGKTSPGTQSSCTARQWVPRCGRVAVSILFLALRCFA